MTFALFERIDTAVSHEPLLRVTSDDYTDLFARYEDEGRTAQAFDALRAGIVDHAVARYRDSAGEDIEPLAFEDGGFEFVFDYTRERTILVHGRTKATAPNSRDKPYHQGFPQRAGYDRGHAIGHALGGREGGPNYFFQRPQVNRRLSNCGHLWRDIETSLASNPETYAFVRLIYAAGRDGDVPIEVEYGVLAPTNAFRALVFPNS